MNKLIKLLIDNRKQPERKFEARMLRAESATAPKEAEVLIYDTIVSSTLEAEWWGGVDAPTFVKTLRDLDVDILHLRLDSPGGSVFAARTMETALREHKARVIVHVDGLAASAASLLAMSGDEVRMTQGSMMMIHKAWTYAYGNADDMKDTAALLDKIDGELATTYANRSGQDTETISKWMGEETWFTAQEAVDAGLADEVKVFGRAPGGPAQAMASWNLSAYVKPPVKGGTPQTQEPRAGQQTEPKPDPKHEPEQGSLAQTSAHEAFASVDHRARQSQRLSVLSRIG